MAGRASELPRGTKKLVERYGPRLVCVRYRYDEEQGKRFKTVELIVDEVPWHPKPPAITGETVVGVRVGLNETDLQWQIKRAGGKWNRERRVWELRHDRVVELGLEARVNNLHASKGRGAKVSTIR